MVSQRQNVERGKGGKWISSKSYPRSRGVWPWKWCLLRMSAHSPTSPHGETGLLFTNWKKSLVFLVEGLGFDIRFWLWHHFKTSSESNPSSLDRESLLPNSKFPKPKMMSCSFERFQFLEYYQEKKKSSSLNSVRSQGVLRKRLFSQSSLGYTAHRQNSLFDFICPTHSYTVEALIVILKDFWLPFPRQATEMPKLFHPSNLKGRKIKPSGLSWIKIVFQVFFKRLNIFIK